MQPEELIYYQVNSRRHPGPGNLFIVAPSAGPVRAIRLDHPSKTWIYDPRLVQRSMMDDFDQGEDRISRVSRSRAEEIAMLLDNVLPSETELHELIWDGASPTSS